MNVLNFAHGQMYVLGGFVTYTVYGQLKLPFGVALLASGVTLAVVGALFERFLFSHGDTQELARRKHDAARGRHRDPS